MTHKPRPKYGWHGKISFVDQYGVTIGSRVCHQDTPGDPGTVVGGPQQPSVIPSVIPDHQVWVVDWDNHGGGWEHTVGTLRLATT